MFQFSNPPRWKVWPAVFSVAAALGGISRSQDFTLMVADPNPLGLGAFVPRGTEFGLGGAGSLKGDLTYGIGIQSYYNSNFFQTETNEEDELYALVSPWLRYLSDPEGGARFSLIVNYTPMFRCYVENPELNGFDQSADATLSFRGARTTVDLFARYAQIAGTDRLSGDFVEGSIITAGVGASRRIASRTALSAGWSYAESDYGSGDNEGAAVSTLYLGGLWEATPRAGFGSTLRYTQSESDNTGTRDAWALLCEVRYRLGERLWLSASLGPEYAVNTDGGRDDASLGLSGELTARYVISERWTWVNSIRSATVPSPSEANYLVNNLAVSTALSRQLLRGSVAAGLQYNFSEYDDVGDVSETRGNENNASVFMHYQRPVLHDRVGLNTGVRYTFNEGSTEWSQWIVFAGAYVTF